MEATFQDHLDDCHGLPLRALLAERSGELEMMAWRADETTPEGPETRNLGKLGWVQSEPPKITKLICNSNIYGLL